MRFSIIFLLYFGDVHIIFLFFAKPFLLCKKYLRSIPNSLFNLKLFILMHFSIIFLQYFGDLYMVQLSYEVNYPKGGYLMVGTQRRLVSEGE